MFRVRPDSVCRASAWCKAGSSSNLGSAPRGDPAEAMRMTRVVLYKRSIYKFLRGLVAWCHSFVYLWNVTVHTVHSFYNIYTFAETPLHFVIAGQFIRCRAENRTRASLTSSRRTTNWATQHPTELRASYWATPHPTELHRPCGATPHPTELRCTLRATPHPLSYASPYWAMRHPTKLYAAPYWATPHPIELCRTLVAAHWEKPPSGAEPRIELGPALHHADALTTDYAAHYWDNSHPTELRRTLLSYTLYPTKLRRTLQSYAAP